jgi:hypothetical protein
MIYWNYDIIEEAQSKDGHDANGNSAGAVINVITKSAAACRPGQPLFPQQVHADGFKARASRLTNAVKEWKGRSTSAVPSRRADLVLRQRKHNAHRLRDGRVHADINRKQYYGFGKITAQLNARTTSLMYNYSRDNLSMFASQFRTPNRR